MHQWPSFSLVRVSVSYLLSHYIFLNGHVQNCPISRPACKSFLCGRILFNMGYVYPSTNGLPLHVEDIFILSTRSNRRIPRVIYQKFQCRTYIRPMVKISSLILLLQFWTACKVFGPLIWSEIRWW